MEKINYVSAAEAVKLIKSGDSVYIQGSTSIPEVLVRAMTDRAGELRGVKVYSAFAIGREDAPYARRELVDSFEAVSFFVANNLRRAIREGVAQTMPGFLGEIPFLFRSGQVPLDVSLLNVSEPDEDGYCSYGISADLAVSAVECSKTVIAQVNRYMPRTFGDPVIHVSKIAALVRGDEPLVELPTVVPNDIERRIGQYIAAEIPDGATMQIGVGGIPNAVLDALHDHKHLGLHTEAMTDGVVPLIEKGIIDNSQKKILPGKSVASLVLGSRRLYDYLDGNRDVVIRDVAWTNDPAIIRQNPRVMAVNSAIEVDLTGQICADSIGETIFSGVGGQHDFMYGGALVRGRQVLHRSAVDDRQGVVEDSADAGSRSGCRDYAFSGAVHRYGVRCGVSAQQESGGACTRPYRYRAPVGKRGVGARCNRALRHRVPEDAIAASA